MNAIANVATILKALHIKNIPLSAVGEPFVMDIETNEKMKLLNKAEIVK